MCFCIDGDGVRADAPSQEELRAQAQAWQDMNPGAPLQLGEILKAPEQMEVGRND